MTHLKGKKVALPKIFIGSSREGLNIANILHEILEEDGSVVSILWKDDIFPPSLTTIESLIKAASEFQYAVFILSPDDRTYSRGEIFPSPRDNLIFEAGLFMGRLGRENTFLMVPESKLKIASDWGGITLITYNIRNDNIINSLRTPANQILRALHKVSSTGKTLFSFIGSIKHYLSKSSLHDKIVKRLEGESKLKQLKVSSEDLSEVKKIADLLIELEEKNWGSREFNIFFNQFTTVKINIYDLLSVICKFELDKIYIFMDSIISLFNKKPDKKIFDAHDLFARKMDNYSAEIRTRFDARRMLYPVSPAHIGDLTYRILQAGQVKYLNIFPNDLEGIDLIEVSDVMKRVRKYGIDVIQSGVTLSPKHIVISYWKPGNISWMVVTATDSDKNDLLLPTETPLVIRHDSKLGYFGDQMRLPSSETVPHWCIHQKIFEKRPTHFEWLLHIHCEPIIKLESIGEEIELPGGIKIPTIPPIDYGTEEMGMEIVSAMIGNHSYGASVRHHGQWFVGQSFRDVLNSAVRAHVTAKQLLKQKKNFPILSG